MLKYTESCLYVPVRSPNIIIQNPKIDHFADIVKTVNFFTKYSILDVLQGSECVPAVQ